jgi:hypothetical protein
VQDTFMLIGGKKVHGQKGKEEEVAVYKVILQL